MPKTLLTILLSFITLAICSPQFALADDDKPADAQAEQNEEQADEQEENSDEEADDDSAGSLAERWLQRVRNFGRRNPNEKNHDNIKTAFTEISGPGSESTALIFSGDKPRALGTVVAKDGFVLTKASELEEDLSCRLSDGRHLSAEVVGIYAPHDLAMLKIDADDLKPVQWEAKQVPPVGSWLVTPGIEEKPLAIGVVSVKTRKIQQTPGVLGVSLEDGEGGALITEVMRRSAAQKAGMKNDDIVLSVNGKRTRNRESMIREIRKHLPGDEVQLKVKRGDEELELAATLGSHFTAGPAARSNFQNALGGSLSMRRAGFEQAVQHDTVLEPHECGGPVLNIDGKAVGINIARAGRVSSYALPAKLIVAVLDDLKSGDLADGQSTERLDRIAALKRDIQQATKTVNDMAARKADAQRRMEQAQEVLKAAQESKQAAEEALNSAAGEVGKADEALEKLQAELEKLESE